MDSVRWFGDLVLSKVTCLLFIELKCFPKNIPSQFRLNLSATAGLGQNRVVVFRCRHFTEREASISVKSSDRRRLTGMKNPGCCRKVRALLFVSDVRGQGLFFGPLHGPLVLVCGSKILVT